MEIDPADVAAAKELLRQRVVTKPKEKVMELETKKPKEQSSKRIWRSRSLSVKRRDTQQIGTRDTNQEFATQVSDFDSRRKKGAKRVEISRSCCMEVCKPEICCKDLIGKAVSYRKLRKIAFSSRRNVISSQTCFRFFLFSRIATLLDMEFLFRAENLIELEIIST